jgi:MFS family permease
MAALKPLYLALGAMFLQQSFATTAKIVVPVVAAVAFPDLGVPASYVGIFSGFYSFCQVIIVLFCGNLIRRYGGLRMSQIGLLSILVGMTAGAGGWLWLFVLTAIFVSFGVSVSTPASSHILARYAPPQHAPLIFSAKQSAVPLGFMIAGLLVPYLTGLYGWQGALIGVGLLCAGFAFVLEPTRRELDQDRDPAYPLSPRNIKGDVLLAVRDRGLRLTIFAQAAFVGLTQVYTTYFVLFCIERLHYTLAEAGGLFAMATFVGLPSRVLWGYVASRWMSPNTVLAMLGMVMMVATALTGFNSPDWPFWAVLTVAVVVNMTAGGWQGVALSEVARLAPKGQVGAITGAVISLSCIGQVILPPIFAAVLTVSGSYALAFALVAVPAGIVAVPLLANRRPAAQAAE